MKLIVANWKMYPKTVAEAKAIFSGIKKGASRAKHTRVVVCPPHLFVGGLVAAAGKARIAIGGQNAFFDDEGAKTGETSPAALKNIGATYAIVGHSERRALGETDEVIAAKACAAVRNKLSVILCVGEHNRDEHGAYFAEVSAQLRASLAGFPKTEAKRLVVAYEPIWAIGAKAKRAATPPDFCEMSILIRRYLTELFGKKVAFTIPILYGGSVDDRNALPFLVEGGADGLLVGRVSLDVGKFNTIITLADTCK